MSFDVCHAVMYHFVLAQHQLSGKALAAGSVATLTPACTTPVGTANVRVRVAGPLRPEYEYEYETLTDMLAVAMHPSGALQT